MTRTADTRTAPIAVTAGEPAGIGPELVAMLARAPATLPWVAIVDPDLVVERARTIGVDVQVRCVTPQSARGSGAGVLEVVPVRCAVAARAGVLDARNAGYVIETLECASRGCAGGEFAAMVTAPVQKSVIADAGIPFTGHTEWLQERFDVPRVVMLLVARELRVALVTTHLALREVADAVTAERLDEILGVLLPALRGDFGIARPRVLVAGLNPHAGEGGHLGREEIEVISPALARWRARDWDVVGPLPADTLFTPRQLEGAHAVLAMYHDQGLPVLKHVGFGDAVNVTLGLPIVRTSVDHGTALDIAGTGTADVGSLRAALALAGELVEHRRAVRL